MGSEMMLLGHNNKQENNNVKSNFTQTCNRFSQFLKERRSLGHVDAFKGLASSELDIKGAKDVSGPRNNNNAKAINLISKNMEKDKVSLELFPLTNARANSTKDNMADYCRELQVSKEESSKNNTTSSPSMTIFYGGKVLVFNELPEDKAEEIMTLASRGTMSSISQAQAPPHSTSTGATHSLIKGVLSDQGVSSLSSFPITRSLSLHRFIEKRKHRLAANAPYQLPNSPFANQAANSHTQKSHTMEHLYEPQQLDLKL